MNQTSLTDRLMAIVEEMLFGAVDKAERGERWDWSSGLSGLGFVPTSATTERAYKGVWNSFFLRLAQAFGDETPSFLGAGPKNPYSTGWWSTYKQWEGLGAQVRKGAKGVRIFVPRTVRVCTTHELAKAGCDECQTFDARGIYFGQMTVFNADQVDGWDPPEMEVPEGVERLSGWTERFKSRSGIDVRFDPGAPNGSFRPEENLIVLPILERFHDAAAAESTFCHEVAHATSILPGTERETSVVFGSMPYAKEELIAESAAWLMGLPVGRAPGEGFVYSSVGYLANWAGKFSTEELSTEISSIAKQAVAASQAGIALISDDA